ncbi:MAG: DNA cytosine methyltransferase [Lachnospiraceae bacterium]
MRLFKGKVAEQVKEDFTNIGYSVRMKILSDDNYGVPQQRKGCFL